jgi:hypothetical protein
MGVAMAKLTKQEQLAIEAVAKHFSATWEKGEDPPDAYVTIARRRTAVEITTIMQRIVDRNGINKPRLRYDRVALRFVRDMQSGLRERAPNGRTVILTVTAPIKSAKKTSAALQEKIRTWLEGASKEMEAKETILGNRIRVRILKNAPRRHSKVIGFVHNADSNPDILLNVTQSLLERIGSKAEATPARLRGDRWLVLANGYGLTDIETYRHVYSQLSIPHDFKKILMVFDGGRVEALTE